jgi:tripeptide aminopeptidase
VKINAVSKQEKPVAEFIAHFLQRLGVGIIEDCAGTIVGGNTGNIIAPVPGASDRQPIALLSHMDTVKPTTGIAPRINGERITSDGNTILGADNRAGIAILLYCIEYILEHELPHIPFEAVFTIGEETGFYGSSNLDLGKIRARQAFVFDSSAAPGSFVYSAPGAVGYNIDLLGRASHAAVNPAAGINAIAMAADLIHNFPIGQVDDRTTINFGTICGGEANNIVPPEVRLSIEIRSFDPDNISHYSQMLNTNLEEITKRYQGKYRQKEELSFPGFSLDLNHATIQRTGEIFSKLGLTPEPMRYHGGSDANILNNRGIHAINLGIGARNPHSVNEYIEIRDLIMMSRFCLELCGVCTDQMN